MYLSNGFNFGLLQRGQRRGDEEPPRVFVRDRESTIPEQVLVHPSSVNAKNSKYDTPYMVWAV